MTITTFNRENLKEVRAMLNMALEAISEDGLEGVTFEVGNMSFSANLAKIGLVARTEGAEQDKTDKVARWCKIHDIANTEKNGWKIVDYHPKKRLYPFIVSRPQGGNLKMTPESVRARFS